MALPIEDYAVIGDRRTAALVGTNGSVDWLCLPHFDSPACLAGLLGTDDHGHWQLVPDETYAVTRRYVGSSAVLETTFTTGQGVVTLTDLMPRNDDRADLVRKVKGIRGTVRMRHEWRVRLDYGRVRPWVRRSTIEGEKVITAVGGPDLLVLRGPRLPVADDGSHDDVFDVDEGDELVVLDDLVPVVRRADRARHRPRSGRGHRGRGRAVGGAVHHRPAAPGGGPPLAAHAAADDRRGHRRDRRGAHDVAARGLRRGAQLGLPLLLAPRRCAHPGLAGAGRIPPRRPTSGGTGCSAPSPATRRDLQIMYAVDGGRRLPEVTLDHLPGYAGSRPVRIGNGAVAQTQHDVLGEVMDALDKVRRAEAMAHDEAWSLQRPWSPSRPRTGRTRTTGSGRSAESRSPSRTRG